MSDNESPPEESSPGSGDVPARDLSAVDWGKAVTGQQEALPDPEAIAKGAESGGASQPASPASGSARPHRISKKLKSELTGSGLHIVGANGEEDVHEDAVVPEAESESDPGSSADLDLWATSMSAPEHSLIPTPSLVPEPSHEPPPIDDGEDLLDASSVDVHPIDGEGNGQTAPSVLEVQTVSERPRAPSVPPPLPKARAKVLEEAPTDPPAPAAPIEPPAAATDLPRPAAAEISTTPAEATTEPPTPKAPEPPPTAAAEAPLSVAAEAPSPVAAEAPLPVAAEAPSPVATETAPPAPAPPSAAPSLPPNHPYDDRTPILVPQRHGTPSRGYRAGGSVMTAPAPSQSQPFLEPTPIGAPLATEPPRPSAAHGPAVTEPRRPSAANMPAANSALPPATTQPPRPSGAHMPAANSALPPATTQPPRPSAAHSAPEPATTQPPRPSGTHMPALRSAPSPGATQPPRPSASHPPASGSFASPARTTPPGGAIEEPRILKPPRATLASQARLSSPPEPLARARSELPAGARARDREPALVGTPITSEPVKKAPALGPKSRNIIGIDLGTTFSCGAFVANGRAQVLASRRGAPQIPSVVAFLPGGKTVVGEAAVRIQATNPSCTVVGSKRLMGRPYSSPIVQELRAHFAYEIVPGDNGEAAVRIDERVITLEEVAAHILREIRENATLQLEERVNRAVITCPAHFTERQRDAVRTAGELAGFYVERILSEPTAAALTYGAGQDINGRKILVYDLGGGTFDVAVLEVRGDVFEVIATGGDTFLGGLDFDACIAELIVERFLEVEQIDARTDPIAMARIFQFAEQAKRELSDRPTTIVEIEHLVVQPYAARTLTLPIRRTRLEEMWAPLVDHTLEIITDVCRRAGLSPGQIDEVIIVGGQSRSPIIPRRVAEYFGKEPNRSLHPDEAIALGAAKYAESMNKLQGGVVLIDALPMSIGVGLPGGRFKKLIPRDSKLPASHSHHLRTTRDDQDSLELILFQGEEERVEFNEPLGILQVSDLPPGPKGSVAVEVTLHVTGECILEISAKEKKSGRTMSWRLGTKDTPEALREKMGLPAHPTHAELEKRKSMINRPKGVWGWLTSFFRGRKR